MECMSSFTLRKSGPMMSQRGIAGFRTMMSEVWSRERSRAMRHARYWGLATVTAQALLNALTVNAKQAVKLLALRGQAPPTIPVSV